MKIDLTKYSNIKATVEAICINNPYNRDCVELISLIAVASGAPAIAAAYYYAAYIGHIDTKVQQNIDSIVKFYGYTEIIGIETVLEKQDVQ